MYYKEIPMAKKLDKILKMCSILNEGDTYIIHGDNYKKQDLIDFAMKFDPTVITLCNALDVIKKMELFQELKRVLKDKDASYNY